MASLKDAAVAADVQATNATNAAQSITNDYAASGLSPFRSQPSARREDYQNAAGLLPESRATSGPMPKGKSASSNVLLYAGAAFGAIILISIMRGR